VEIVGDDRLLGGWLRLLLLAEAAWPQSVAIPRALSRRTLAVLVEAGVVELHSADTYRIHGLDPERQKRSEHGREAAQRRWDAPSNAPGIAPSNAISNAHPMLGARNADPMLAPRSRSRKNERDDLDHGVVPSGGTSAYETAKAVAAALREKG
jgi:hypothetical protein